MTVEDATAVRWSSVLSRSAVHPAVFYVRGTRGRDADTAVSHRIEKLLEGTGVQVLSESRRGAWDAWRYVGAAFLDGGYTAQLSGAAWSYGGAYIVGFASFRFVCGLLGLTPPRRLKHEPSAPLGFQELQDLLSAQLDDDLTMIRLEGQAKAFQRVYDYDTLRDHATGRRLVQLVSPVKVASDHRQEAGDRSVGDQADATGDPLQGRSGKMLELVAALSDSNLDRYMAYWRRRMEDYRTAGNGHSEWWCSKHLSIGRGVREVRKARAARKSRGPEGADDPTTRLSGVPGQR